jgi:hypothetical protein
MTHGCSFLADLDLDGEVSFGESVRESHAADFGADAIWPSTELAGVAADRLDARDHPWSHEHLVYPDAGHAIRTPYRFEAGDAPTGEHRLGGTHRANARAAADAWRGALDYLRSGLDDR